MSFEEHVKKMALSHGLSGDASTQDLHRHARAELQRTIGQSNRGQPGRPVFQAIPAPKDGGNYTIEVRAKINPQDEALAGITEDGIKSYKGQLRRDLARLLVGELERSDWIGVKIENGEAIATLVIVAPEEDNG